MKKMKKPGSWNFSKDQPKEHGCRACLNNDEGSCIIYGRDIPLTYTLKNSKPNWCKVKK